MEVDFTCFHCGRDHPVSLTGCPFEGRPPKRTRPPEMPVEERIQQAERQRALERAIMLRDREAAEERRQREFGKIRTLLREVVRNARAQEAVARQGAMGEIQEVLDNIKFITAYEERQRVKRLAERGEQLMHPRDRPADGGR